MSAGTRRAFRELSTAWHVRHRGERPKTSFPPANVGASGNASSGRDTTSTAKARREAKHRKKSAETVRWDRNDRISGEVKNTPTRARSGAVAS